MILLNWYVQLKRLKKFLDGNLIIQISKKLLKMKSGGIIILRKRDILENIYTNEEKIKVVGDIMLDKWCEGKFHKKSAEAPINIFLTKNISYSLGGVGNLCVNLKSLKVKHHLFQK